MICSIMIDMARRLIEFPEVIDHLARRFDCLVIDEFQDTNPLQFAMLWKRHRQGVPALVVGDVKQSILGFQSADPDDRHAALYLAVTELGTDDLTSALGRLLEHEKPRLPMLERLAAITRKSDALTVEDLVAQTIETMKMKMPSSYRL